MILVDANLLIYAHVASAERHQAARAWLDGKLNGTARVGLPWPSLLAFVRLVINPRVFARPEPIAKAWRQVEEWLGCDTVWIPEPTAHHGEVLGRLLREGGMRTNLVPDAHLAALAIEHGLTISSCDSDFARFSGVRWENPLATL
ncbi:MAG: type II toxin-antitoxin system VapC family toxin [Myxococcales bacterium]|nr:type II toxin-antitoxin system VapC family toxin [Myxococcales bacterium]